MRRWRWRWILVGLAVVAALFLGSGLLFREDALEVQVVTATQGRVEDVVTNSQAGTVRARRRARIGFERAGRVAQILHREGARVRRGTPLMRLDSSTQRLQREAALRDLETVRASVAAAEAAARLAAGDFERIEALRPQGLVSQEHWDQARSRRDAAAAELSAARARVARAAAAVRLAREELAHLEITAPFDGAISERWVEVGESVVPGTPALELASVDDLYVVAPIDEVDMARVRQGLPARVGLDPFPGRTWPGTVSRVPPVINEAKEQNRTLDVEIALAPVVEGPEPKPGTSADVEIILSARDGVLRVPTFAVVENRRVWVIDKGKATPKEIEPGLRNWDWTEVRKGLEAGAQVITSLDRRELKPGMPVEPERETRGAPRPGGATAAADTAAGAGAGP